MKSRIRPSNDTHHGLYRAFVVILACQAAAAFTTIVSPSAHRPISSPSERCQLHRKSLPMRPSSTSPTTLFGIVIDPPSSSSSSSFFRGREEEEEEDNSSSSSWTPSPNGGFFANIPQQIKLLRQKRKNRKEDAPPVAPDTIQTAPQQQPHEESLGIKSIQGIPQVTDILQYKQQVVEVQDYDFVAVRFYAPWCKACKAIEQPFRRLAKEDNHKAVKFVEVPVTKENAYLHQGLGIPSLPFAHIYQVNSEEGSTLVEEMKISKKVFGDFKRTLENYVNGECPMTYEDENDGASADEA